MTYADGVGLDEQATSERRHVMAAAVHGIRRHLAAGLQERPSTQLASMTSRTTPGPNAANNYVTVRV